MENNRTFLAIALVILIWSGYSLLFPPQNIEQNTLSNEKEIAIQNNDKKDVVINKISEVKTNELESKNIEEKTLIVESDIYKYSLSSKGAKISSAVLKKYKKENEKNSSFVDIVGSDNKKHFTFKTFGKEDLFFSDDIIYNVEKYINEDGQSVKFFTETNTGLFLVKTFRFYNDNYEIDINTKIINNSSEIKRGFFNISLVNYWEEERKGDTYNFVGPTSLVGEELIEDDPDDIETSSKTYKQNVIWSGFFTKYFASILSPSDDSSQKLQIEMGEGFIENIFSSPYLTLGPTEGVVYDYVAFMGPKDYDILSSVGHHFEKAIDFGFFSILAKPLMVALKFFYKYLGNWGFAIVLLTVCIKAIFWPLTQKSYSSMKAMQKLQPQMTRLREKYSSDKQRLNQEMMSLYKENRVNPFGGCLPMLIQIPVFFALYQVLLGSIELRHAPFVFWLTDLSAKDPYYITPLVMGATMFLQQKMTPTTMEPMQAKMMMMMPVVFTFLFLNFPSGLVIYWLVNNVLTIAQQYLINKNPA
ncbi:MAG: protein translocase component YidC [Desulfuromonas sp.]|nr:MAG: protein translocase component YidC [Desulfuromonas sp.]